MVVQSGVYLYNSAVNSGLSVWCAGATISYGWQNNVNVDPVPGKFDIVEGDVTGWQNPIITITGTLDIDDDTVHYLDNRVIKSFARANATQTYISIGLGNSVEPITKSDVTYDENVKGAINGVWIPVIIKGYTLSTEGERGHILRYQLTCIEESE